MFMSICVLSRYAKKKRYTRTEEDDCRKITIAGAIVPWLTKPQTTFCNNYYQYWYRYYVLGLIDWELMAIRVWVIIVYATMLCYQAFFRSYSRANVRGILSIENCDSRKHANATNISEHVKLTSLVSIIYLYAHVLIEILPPFLFCSTEQSQ